MTKRLLTLLAFVTIAITSYGFQVDGINYYITSSTNKTVRVTGIDSNSDIVVIPSDVTYNNVTYNVTVIGDRAFSGCSGLISIEIPISVTSIGTNAFYGCSGLTSVKIPNSVNTIGGTAFAGCSSLTSVTISNSVKTISDSMFSGCSKLASIEIPNSVTSICGGAFGGCSSLASVTIPNSVTSVGDWAFYSCTALHDVYCYAENIPSTDSRAFENTDISSATLHVPASAINTYKSTSPWSGFGTIVALSDPVSSDQRNNVVTSNTAGADVSFSTSNTYEWGWDSANSRLRSTNYNVDSSTSQTTIRITATQSTDFSFAYSVSSEADYDKLTILLDGTTIVNAISGTTSSTYSSTLSTGSHTLVLKYTKDGSVNSGNDRAYISNIQLTTKKVLVTDITFNRTSETLAVGESMYLNATVSPSNASDRTVTWSSSDPNIVSVDAETGKITAHYYGYATITATAKDGSNVTGSIGVSSVTRSSYFDAYIGGIYYKLDSSTKEATITYKDLAYNSYAGSVEIPEKITLGGVEYSVTTIGLNAFSVSSGLTSVTIPNSVKKIDGYAFYKCTNLTSITIPNSVISIKYGAFCNCSNLASVTMPNAVTSIESSTFYSCPSLTSINIPSSVTSIGDMAFYSCSGLTSVTIPNSVKSFGYATFEDCSGLTSVTIPNSVTSIGGQAFYNCSGLTSVTIPNSVTSIGVGAFGGCSDLIAFTVEKGNPYFDSRDNCNAMIQTSTNILIFGCKNTVIPNSVTSIGVGAFDGCSGLTSITIPNSVTSIENGAFNFCSSLTSITCEGTVPPTIEDSSTFSGVPTTALVEVPYGAVSAYKSAEGWNNFTNIYTLGDANLSGTEPDVTDFNYTVNYILGEEPTGFFFTGADYNKNGVVNVIDAIAIGRLITNGTTVAQAKKLRAPAMNNNEYGLDILCTEDAITAAGTEFTMPVSITPDRYSSMQMDIQIPEGFSVVDVTNGTGAEGHSLFHGMHDDGVLRIMLGSLENTKMGETPIVNIKLVATQDLADGLYDFYISNILAVTPELETTSGKTLNAVVSVGDATSIKGANLSGLKLARTDGGINITTDATQTVAIRTIDGKFIANEHINAGETKTITLPAGIYIINHNKITVK